VRENFRSGIGELAALVERQKARGHLAHVEFPGFSPLPRLGKLQRRGADLKFGKRLDVVDGAMRRLGENGRVVLHLALMVPDLLDPPYAEWPIHRVAAANMRARFDL